MTHIDEIKIKNSILEEIEKIEVANSSSVPQQTLSMDRVSKSVSQRLGLNGRIYVMVSFNNFPLKFTWIDQY